jgi:uncharacterized protein (TIGR02145 family)
MIPFSAFSPSADAPTGTVWYLTDAREGGNNNTYKVKKLTNGRIWMVQDLKFGTCPNSTESWYDDNSADATTHEPTVFAGYVGHCRSSAYPNAGFLYTWAAALQNKNAYFGSNALIGCSGSYGDGACQGICPDGWHLPTANSSGQNEFNLANFQDANEFSFGGVVDPLGALSYVQVKSLYWSASYLSPQTAYTWTTSPPVSSSHGDLTKNSGATVRCVQNY